VLSDPTKHGGRWAVDEFYETGRAHVAKLLRILDEAGVTFARGDCLDVGCGAGRLTIPPAASFDRTVGVDVARSMIGPAARHVPGGVRCDFVVNRDPDLRRFPRGSFDFVHSCLVLQHIPPEIALRYIGEFLRICRPGGLAVFQVPAETRSEAFISAMHALPAEGYDAGIAIRNAPAALEAGARVALDLALTNRSPVEWRHDIPAGRHICIANHWLREDGTTAVADDGRAYLPKTVAPGETVLVELQVQAPEAPGTYLVDVDLVQERVCWFAERGSRTARAPIVVKPAQTVMAPPPVASAPRRRPSLFQRLRRRVRGGTPTFEMHVISRASIEEAVRASGGDVLRAIDDNAAGERWLSYTYVCRKGTNS
jgi:SAM-dependent methyltransferase